jgi:hypothetical protein
MSDQRNLTRRDQRVIARERRKAAQRAAALAFFEERKRATERDEWQRPKLGDALALGAIPLGYAGLTAENNLVVGVCLTISGLFLCAPIAWHREIRRLYRILSCIFIAVFFFGLFWIIKEQNLEKELSKNAGFLIPDNQPRPKTQCPMNDDDFAIFAGGGVWSGQRPSTFLSMRGQDLVKLEGTPAGNLQLKEIHLFDDLNESLAEIRDNKLWVHANARRERPDSHTLVVFDRRGKEALGLRFINRNTILLSGIFRVENRPPARITDSEIEVAGIHVRGPCLSRVGRGFTID